MEIRETVGSIGRGRDGNIIINRAAYGQGYIYKNWQAFETGCGICYIPELSDAMYTRSDFEKMCNDQKEIAEAIFESVDWQHPETYVDEQFVTGELYECQNCGKWFWCYSSHKCPHCGKENDG